jgi:hypothetical protein
MFTFLLAYVLLIAPAAKCQYVLKKDTQKKIYALKVIANLISIFSFSVTLNYS